MSTSTVSAMEETRTQGVESQILGRLDVPAEEVFHFPKGLFGFPACTRWVLVPSERQNLLWLQSLDHASLAFLLVDPFTLVDEFFVDLPEGDRIPLKAGKASDIGILAIVTLPETPEDSATANLQGLLALNFPRRLGRQVIIQDSEYGTRFPLDLRRLSLAS